MNFGKIGRSIYFLRKARNMSQKELAEGICSQAQISKIENNEVYPFAPTLFLISQRLGVDVNYFFSMSTHDNFHYFTEVETALNYHRKNEDYAQIQSIITVEKKNPLFNQSKPYKQLLLWHEAIVLFNNSDRQIEALALLDEAISCTNLLMKSLSEREIEIINTRNVFLLEQKDFRTLEESQQFVLKQLDQLPFIKDPTLKTRVYYNVAKAHFEHRRIDQCLHYCKKAVRNCSLYSTTFLLPELYLLMSKGYSSLNLQEQSRTYYQLYLKKSDSLELVFCEYV